MVTREEAEREYKNTQFDFVLQYPNPQDTGEFKIVAFRASTQSAADLCDLLRAYNVRIDECYPEQGQGFLGWTIDEILEHQDEREELIDPKDWADQLVSSADRNSEPSPTGIILSVARDTTAPLEWRREVINEVIRLWYA